MGDIQIGIEAIGFYTTNAVFPMQELAKLRNQDFNKYQIGLMQEQMSIIAPYEDIITMAYNATMEYLNEDDKNIVDLLLFATESAIDNSKSAACELHSLLNLSKSCRCLEVKHACYGGTGALMLAKNYISANPNTKALVIMSDIAFYGLNTKGEPTQGCGAVSILVSANPKIAVFNNNNVFLTENKNDFYRPIFRSKPICDGRFSIKSYLTIFEEAFKIYNKTYTFDFLISHMPFAKMLEKCCKIANIDVIQNENSSIQKYCKNIGNIYTASLYVGFLSLLENANVDLTGKKILMASYGSGCECELFSLTTLDGYKKYLNVKKHKKILSDRKILNCQEYYDFWQEFENREQSLNWKLDCDKYKKFITNNDDLKLAEIKNGARLYKKVLSD